MTPEEINRLAEQIVDDLFTDGNGIKAERLVMRSDTDNRYGAGWSVAGATRCVRRSIHGVLAEPTP